MPSHTIPIQPDRDRSCQALGVCQRGGVHLPDCQDICERSVQAAVLHGDSMHHYPATFSRPAPLTAQATQTTAPTQPHPAQPPTTAHSAAMLAALAAALAVVGILATIGAGALAGWVINHPEPLSAALRATGRPLAQLVGG